MVNRASTARSLQGPTARRMETVAIASGKGGVGKTNVVANLAAALGRRGRRVLVLDADFGLSNLDVLLGLAPRYHVGHFLAGERRLEEILVEGPEGIRILPAASGLQDLTALSEADRRRLLDELESLEAIDFLLVDTAAGISPNVTGLLGACRRALIVTDPEPTSLVDAYALIKVMDRLAPAQKLEVVVNSVGDEAEANEVYHQIARVSRRFLGRGVGLFGWVARDPMVTRAVRAQRLVVLAHPDSPASVSFAALAKRLDEGSGAPAPMAELVAFPARPEAP